MSEGNPGALMAVCEILKHGAVIDPNDAMGGMSSLLSLDTLGVYGSQLYMLWSDVCGKDVGKMIALLRAWQLGGLAGVTDGTLQFAIDARGTGIDVDAAVAAVQERLPKFNAAARAERVPV